MYREALMIKSPRGALIEAVLERPKHGRDGAQDDSLIGGIALVAHPHPLHGGTMDNKVVHTLSKAFVECNMAALRFNFRGIGASEGHYDAGEGESEDLLFLTQWMREKFPNRPLYAGGFSFGAFVTAKMAHEHPNINLSRMVLVGTPTKRFLVQEVAEQTIVVHGSLDETVPLNDVLTWAAPQKLAVLVLAGADHFFHQRLIQLRHLIISALRDGTVPLTINSPH